MENHKFSEYDWIQKSIDEARDLIAELRDIEQEMERTPLPQNPFELGLKYSHYKRAEGPFVEYNGILIGLN